MVTRASCRLLVEVPLLVSSFLSRGLCSSGPSSTSDPTTSGSAATTSVTRTRWDIFFFSFFWLKVRHRSDQVNFRMKSMTYDTIPEMNNPSEQHLGLCVYWFWGEDWHGLRMEIDRAAVEQTERQMYPALSPGCHWPQSCAPLKFQSAPSDSGTCPSARNTAAETHRGTNTGASVATMANYSCCIFSFFW